MKWSFPKSTFSKPHCTKRNRRVLAPLTFVRTWEPYKAHSPSRQTLEIMLFVRPPIGHGGPYRVKWSPVRWSQSVLLAISKTVFPSVVPYNDFGLVFFWLKCLHDPRSMYSWTPMQKLPLFTNGQSGLQVVSYVNRTVATAHANSKLIWNIRKLTDLHTIPTPLRMILRINLKKQSFPCNI